MRRYLRIGCFDTFLLVVTLLSLVGAFIAPWLFDPLIKGGKAGISLPDTAARSGRAAGSAPQTEPFTVLLLGLDARPSERTGRSDAIVVARYDPKANRLFLLSVPRDTRAEIPGHGVGKVNTAYVLGGPELVEKTVSQLLDLKIDRYAVFRWEGFIRAVDLLGGVELEVEYDMRHRDSSAGALSEINLRAGRQKLDGKKALQYVRWRNDGKGDIGRVGRQQKLLKALAKETLKPENLPHLPRIAAEVLRHTDTNISPAEVVSLLSRSVSVLSGGLEIEAATLPGEAKTIGGASYWIVDEQEAKRFARDFLFN